MDELRERINFLKTFAADKNVGALTVSSRFVVQHVIKQMPASPRTVIECGPGEGVMTRGILKHLSPNGTFLAIEANKGFVSLLRGMHDGRLLIAEGKAQDMIMHARKNNIGEVDFILASIPFSFLTPAERLGIVRDAHKLLAPKGMLTIFNYSPLMHPTMKKIFGNASLSFEVRNFPPYFIMTAQKD